jgi:CRP-like cAMP-binding protein
MSDANLSGWTAMQPGSDSFVGMLSSADRAHLASLARRRSYASDTALFRQGDVADYVVIVERGWVKIAAFTQGREEGQEVVLAIRGSGDLIGEAALIGRPRWATVTAVGGPLEALILTADRFVRFLDRHPNVWRTLTAMMVNRSEETARQLKAHASADGAQRLAQLLSDLVERHGVRELGGDLAVRPPMSQEELAGWTGTSRQTVARALRNWRQRDLIRTERRKIIITDLPGLNRIAAQHCVLFAVDIAGSTDSARDDEFLKIIRDALYQVLQTAFQDAGLAWDECYREDRGDGVLVIIPANMPSATVVDPLLDLLSEKLRRYNKFSSLPAQIRLRVAVHIGEVHKDDYGVSGTAINHLFRLLDAAVLKAVLAREARGAALIASEYFYESVIRHGPGRIDPDVFRQVAAEVKGTRIKGWIYAPGVVIPAVVGGGTDDEVRLVHRVVLAVDIASYSARGVHEQAVAQTELNEVLDRAAGQAGLDRSQWRRQPCGSGELAVLPPDVDEPAFIDEFNQELRTALRSVNGGRHPSARLRLHLALHHGMLAPGPFGAVGIAPTVVTRLLTAKAVRRSAMDRKRDLTLVVSASLYDDVIRTGFCRLAPEDFQPVPVGVDGMSVHGYIYTPHTDTRQAAAADSRGA